LPQLIFLGNGKLAMLVDGRGDADPTRHLEQFRRELGNPKKLKLSPLVVDRPDPALPNVQPAIIRSSKRSYLIRAQDPKIADSIITALKSSKLMESVAHDGSPAIGRSVQAPPLHAYRIVKWGNVCRAVAKVALNFVCAAVGSEVARRPAFDPIRRYILTGESDSAASGGGFVAENLLLGEHRGVFDTFTKPGHHTIILIEEFAGTPMVFLCLYEKPFAAVRLTRSPAPGALPPETFEIGLFDYTAKTSRLVGRDTDPIGLLENFQPPGFM
jgi:hypothetical protein